MTDDGWVEVDREYSESVLIAVGRLSLSFAALDVGLSMVMARVSGQSLGKACKPMLGQKLDLLDSNQKYKRLQGLIPTGRIRELCKVRNDLAHGLTFVSLWRTKHDELAAWNPHRERVTDLTPSALDGISKEVRAITDKLPYNCPRESKSSN